MAVNHRFEHPVTEKLYQALAMIEQGEALLDKAIEELPILIGDNEELRQTVISYLYWHEEKIKASWIADAFGMKDGTRVGKIAGYASLTRICKTCQQEFELTITSRANLKEVKTNSGVYRWKERDICSDCLEKEKINKAEQDSRYREMINAHEAERQAHLEYLRTMPYREYLQTPEWQERRKKAMKRAGFRCQVCNAYGVRLNTHHRTYERRGNEYDKDLIVLCQNCHQIFHDNGSLVEDE